jgi:hypothetical protein
MDVLAAGRRVTGRHAASWMGGPTDDANATAAASFRFWLMLLYSSSSFFLLGHKKDPLHIYNSIISFAAYAQRTDYSEKGQAISRVSSTSRTYALISLKKPTMAARPT